ncbi:hypothetical protein ISF_08456 [Cordyceps fumosorosea ARSEF 2679]|uniref:Uncharacterized protein n=1 Tax=Cordyceps fumosorosea (strain ARSEF 2679) TaxID=1081104 RepID=A0A167MDC6_CORFA|nr:hypothetical protein ISF_08456 [Cordyceps fumosorosea ARSEF 2679]OAA54229.1 hypothetical protein ISF_08456 [Cordyceps fumosorosea ARSEF 2679]
MKPSSTALVLSMAVLGQCDGQDTTATLCTKYVPGSVQSSTNSTTTTSTSCTSAQYGPPAAPSADTYTSGFVEYTFSATPAIGTGSASTSCTSINSETSSVVVPTNATIFPTTNSTSTSILLGPSATRRASPTGAANTTSETTVADSAEDDDGKPDLGFDAFRTLFDTLPPAPWGWKRLPEPGNFVTNPPYEFKDAVCTGDLVEPFEERRATRHLEWFCNRWIMPRKRLFSSTAGRATIYICLYGDGQPANCSLGLWRAASAAIDRECGVGVTGYVHLDKMRLGRDMPDNRVLLCENLHWSPLFQYHNYWRHEPVLVDDRPYKEWRILNNRRLLKKESEPEDINEGNDADSIT